MALRQITGTTGQCVSVEDVKDFLRIQTTAEDAMLEAFITAAETWGENYTKRSFMRQQWELRVDDFPSVSTGMIKLPRGPLSTVSTEVVVTYVEDTTVGNTTTISSSALSVDYYSIPGYVYPSYDNDWPDDVRDERNAVRITYYTGKENAVHVPEEIKHWIKLRVGSMYENRESVMVGNFGNQFAELPRSYVDGLLDPYVLMEHK